MAIAKFDLAAWQEFKKSSHLATKPHHGRHNLPMQVRRFDHCLLQRGKRNTSTWRGLQEGASTQRHYSRHQLDLLYHQASSQDISAKHFLKAAGFFRGCAVTVVNCEQSVGCHFLSFIPLGLSALHA